MSQRFRKLTNSGGGGGSGGISEGAGTDISDNVIVRGDSGTDDVQGSVLSLSDTGTITSSSANPIVITPLAGQALHLDDSNVAVDGGVLTITGQANVDALRLDAGTVSAQTGDLTVTTVAADSSIIINTTGTGIHYFSNDNNQQAQINNAGTFEQAGTNGYRMIGVTSHDGVTPSFIPDKADPNTGFGHGTAADTTSVIAGGVEAISSTATATTVAGQLNVDNVRVDGNTVSAQDANGVLILSGPGNGGVQTSRLGIGRTPVSGYDVRIGASAEMGILAASTVGYVAIASSMQYVFGSTDDIGVGRDTGLARNAAATLRTTDASSGIGFLLTKIVIEANTAGSGAPNLLAATESRTLLTNQGTTAQNYHTLPSAASGLQFTFVVQDTDGIRIVANTGDTIQPGNVAASAAAGFIQNSTTGSSITLVAINDTEWMATSIIGTWTVDS